MSKQAAVNGVHCIPSTWWRPSIHEKATDCTADNPEIDASHDQTPPNEMASDNCEPPSKTILGHGVCRQSSISSCKRMTGILAGANLLKDPRSVSWSALRQLEWPSNRNEDAQKRASTICKKQRRQSPWNQSVNCARLGRPKQRPHADT